MLPLADARLSALRMAGRLFSTVFFVRAAQKCSAPAQTSRHRIVGYGLVQVHLMADCQLARWRDDQPLAHPIDRIDKTQTRGSDMKKFIVDFLKDEEGLTMVEYAIAGGLVAAVGAAVFTTLGTNVSTKISELATDVAGA